MSLPSGERVCLIRRGGLVTALHDECTHQGMPLSAGELMEDGTVECPWHGARFDGATGEPRRGPAEVPVATFDVRVEGDRVLVPDEPAMERLLLRLGLTWTRTRTAFAPLSTGLAH